MLSAIHSSQSNGGSRKKRFRIRTHRVSRESQMAEDGLLPELDEAIAFQTSGSNLTNESV
jgi:hypothetical protein